MLKRAWLSLAILAALGWYCLGSPLSRPQKLEITPSPPLQNLGAFLPDKGELQNWKAENAPQLFKGEDLYLYIDGGAEIYHEYGFKQVLIQDYKSAAGKSLTLEIFEMANPECAFGIFTFKSSGTGKPISLGQDGQLEEYYLNFWKGNALVTLTGFDSSPEVIQGLMLVAKSVDAKIKTPGRRPSLVEIFPKEWLPIARLKYIKGVLGLRNSDSYLPRHFFGFNDGVIGTNDEKRLASFIFRYSSAEECRRKFREAKAAFEKSADGRNFRNLEPDFFTVTDSQARVIYARTFENCLALFMTKEGQEFAANILAMLRDNYAKIK